MKKKSLQFKYNLQKSIYFRQEQGTDPKDPHFSKLNKYNKREDFNSLPEPLNQ